jgi:DNA-binding LacI/PurR family transcriptional regulator
VRKVTVYDVAELAGVSIATVSFAFTRPDRVKAETLRTVMAAADQLGYVPSGSARGLARGRTGAIGIYSYDYLLDPDHDKPATDAQTPAPDGRLFPLYADEVQRGVQIECRRRGYALMLGGNRASDQLPHVIEVAGRVDGLIAFAGALTDGARRQVTARIPVVELGGLERDGARTVLVDNEGGMFDLARHLIEQHRHRRFAYVGELGTEEFKARRRGFERALGASGITAPEVIPAHAGDDASTLRAVSTILVMPDLPDVIVCDTDQSALAAIVALRAAGLRVPDDVAVTGFDGILAGRIAAPVLTTVRQPMEQIGRVAVEILARALDGPDDATPAPVPVLTCTLFVGSSCGTH